MNWLTRNELKTLAEEQRGPCISILLPTSRTGVEAQQTSLQLRNALRDIQRSLLAEEQLYGLHRSTQVEELLEPISALLTDAQFWAHPTDGLAIFRSPQLFRQYWLPFSVKERVMLSEHFCLEPLLPLLTGRERFYVLALSQNEIRLLEGTRYSIHEVELPESVPENLKELLKTDHKENDVRHYSSASGGQAGRGGRQAAIFYGQGAGIDDNKDNLLRYFRRINKGLREVLHEETVPMVLAGVEYLLPIYRESNTYPNLLEETIAGNPDRLKIEALHEKAWNIIAPYALEAQHEAEAAYRASAGTGLTSTVIDEIIPAAGYGRVESLFVAEADASWGTYDPTTCAVHVHPTVEPGDDDLLNVAAIQTFLHNGATYVVDRKLVPGGGSLAAVYRY